MGCYGCSSVAALVAWKTGVSPHTAQKIVAVARRLEEFPRCAAGMREGRFSLDQVGVIAERAPEGSDGHFANMAASATVNQLSTALKLEPPPEPEPDPKTDDDEDEAPPPRPEPPRSFSKTSDEQSTTYRLTLPHDEAAIFDAAVDSHRDALITDWKRDHDADDDRDTDGYTDDADG